MIGVQGIDPALSANGPEWSVGGIGATDPATQQPAGGSFGGMLTSAISNLDQSQSQAATAAQSLATGTASDPSAVVTQVERASLEMQLASQIRSKAVDAYNDIFHTQV